MSNQVSFNLSGGDVLGLSQTGPNAAALTEGGSSYPLANIRHGRNQLDCDVLGMFGVVEAHIAVQWAHDELTLTVSKAWLPSKDGTQAHRISAQDMSRLMAWLKSANFPAA